MTYRRFSNSRPQRDEGIDARRRIYNFISEYIHKNTYPPTLREIADCAGISSISLVSYHLGALEKLGYISRKSTLSRTIRIIKPFDSPATT